MATGHIRDRETKNGKVSYQLVIEQEPDPITGERKRQYKTVHCTKKEAAKMLRGMIDAVEHNLPINQSSQTLSSWMDEWLENYLPNIAETTRAGYKNQIKNYIHPSLGKISLKSLQGETIQKWINMLYKEKELSAKTIKNVYLNLNSALKKAVTLKKITFNPCEGVELPKQQKQEMQFYDKPEIATLLSEARGKDIYLSVLLAVSLGLRRGELLGLMWDDVDLTNKVIHIRRSRVIAGGKVIVKAPKSSAGIRDLTIGDELVKELAEARMQYLKDKKEIQGFHDTGYVIRKKDGSLFRPDTMTQKWSRFAKRLELKYVHLHGLRHTCATAMVSLGIDLKTTQHRLGHADISTTMNIYAHCTKEMDENAATKIDNVIFQKASNQ